MVRRADAIAQVGPQPGARKHAELRSPGVTVYKNGVIDKRSLCEIRGPLKPGLRRERWTDYERDHADEQGD